MKRHAEINKLNLRRGFLRLWIFLSIIWFIIVFFAFGGVPSFLPRNFNVQIEDGDFPLWEDLELGSTHREPLNGIDQYEKSVIGPGFTLLLPKDYSDEIRKKYRLEAIQGMKKMIATDSG